MKKKKKVSRMATALMAGVCALTAAGVGGATLLGEQKADAAAEIGSRNTFNEFTIAGFMNYYDQSILSLDEQTVDLARSGINWVDFPGWQNTGSVDVETFDWEHFNRLCEDLNMWFDMRAYDSLTDAGLQKMVKKAKDLSRCIGYEVEDEPSAAQLQTFADICRKLQELDSTRFPHVNLYPNYAGASNLGGSYEDYVRNWVAKAGDAIEYLYFDHYPFTQFEDVRASYFSDVETIRKVAWENNRLKTGGYTQTGWWNGMRRPTPAETRWSMNSLLTYGLKSISHFCWVSPLHTPPPAGEGFQDFVIKVDGTPTDRYEPMQKLNWQTRQLGPVLMSFDVAHAYHSGNVPTGTEELPRSFLLQPNNQTDNLIFSLGYSKDDSEKYVMLFNKELEGTKSYTINVDKSSGLTSLTWYKPDAFETLPDYTKDLAPAEEVNIDISSGSFTVELQAGEMRLYKLNGNVAIKEPLQAPQISHKSGTYIGEQTVTLTSIDSSAEIYYTTDGTYPTYKSARYDGPIKVGNGREFGFYNVKAIAVRGTEVSDAVTAQYIISDGSENVALGKPVSFTGETTAFTGTANPSLITDGNLDPRNVYASVNNNPCFAVIDFGDEYSIDKVTVKAYHDWTFADVVIQLATDKNFTQNVYTVFNNDTDNSVGEGTGTDGEWKEVGYQAKTFTFTPVQARYMRFHNLSVQEAGKRYSMWEEMQAYTSYNAGTELLTSASDWQMTGGGNWVWNNGTLSQTGAYDQSSWDRSYTYKVKKFKNFILEGKFKMNVSNPSAWGYVGFGLYKPQVSNVQSNVDKGFYAVIEPRGRALLWNGERPELGPEDANVAGFSLGGEFIFRVVSVDDTISISVNGKPVMYVQKDILNREAGYISVHGGLVPMDVSSVRIIELSDAQKPIADQDNIKNTTDIRLAVERFTQKADIIAQLPATVQTTTVAGRKIDVPVTWRCDNYDPSATGYATFVGTFGNLPAGIKNTSSLTATANVFVKPYTDKHDLVALVELGRSLHAADFTAASWAQMLIKLEAAEAMLADEFLVQNDIGVGVVQLYGVLYGLESTLDRSSLQEAIEGAKTKLTSGDYTEVSKTVLQAAIDAAESVYTNPFASSDDVTTAEQTLKKAVNNAVAPIEIKAPAEKPTESTTRAKKGCCCGSDVATAGSAAAAVTLLGGATLALAKKKKKEKA